MDRIIEFTSDTMGIVGMSYVPTMWFLRDKPNAMLSVRLLFFGVWIKLPWPHVMDKKYGESVAAWGFAVRLSPFHFQYQIKYKTKIFLYGQS